MAEETNDVTTQLQQEADVAEILDKAELLGMTPAEYHRWMKDGERPLESREKAEGEGPEQPATETVPETAVLGATKAADVWQDRYRRIQSLAAQAGISLDDEGNVTSTAPPAQPFPQAPMLPGMGPQFGQAPPVDDELVQMAEQAGLDPARLVAAIDKRIATTVTPIAQATYAPMLAATVESNFERMKASDPEFRLYEDRVRFHVQQLGPLAAYPGGMELARKLAQSDRLSEIVTHRANPGKVVGRFVEGAAPGIVDRETPPGPVIDPRVFSWARQQGFSSEDIERAAALKAEREKRSGR